MDLASLWTSSLITWSRRADMLAKDCCIWLIMISTRYFLYLILFKYILITISALYYQKINTRTLLYHWNLFYFFNKVYLINSMLKIKLFRHYFSSIALTLLKKLIFYLHWSFYSLICLNYFLLYLAHHIHQQNYFVNLLNQFHFKEVRTDESYDR